MGSLNLNPFAQLNEVANIDFRDQQTIQESQVAPIRGMVTADPNLTPDEKSLLLTGLNFETRQGKYDQFVAAKKKAEEIVGRRRSDIANQVGSAGREGSILTGGRGLDFAGKSILDPNAAGVKLR